MDDSIDPIAELAARYLIVEQPAVRRVERRVIGADYGATGYTTKDQADGLAEHLRLQAGMCALEVGCGAGWPGIYLAARTGAEIFLTDVAFEGLAVAARRLRKDSVSGAVVAATGAALPFRDGSFDAATSSDVLC